MATARLRRTFHYPADSEEDDAVEEGMDEQDQATLITTLSTRDTSSTNLYTHLLLVLPLVPAVLYLPRLLSIYTIIPSLAAMTSLIASAYILYFLPLPPVRVGRYTDTTNTQRYKPKQRAAASPFSSVVFSAPESRAVPGLSEEMVEQLRKYIIPVNSAICAILAVLEILQGRSWSEGMMIGGGYVPGFVFAFILWARRELRVFDLGELEKLRGSGTGQKDKGG